MSNPRIIAWDLETSNLNANFGYVLCAGWKIIGEKKTNVIRISDYPLHKTDCTNDYEVVKRMGEALADADGIVTWFGQFFDEPYLNSRLLIHGLPLLPPFTAGTHIDGWRIARKKLKLNSNRLASVSSFLGVEEKTPLNGPIWVKAMSGHLPSLRYVYKHCEQDVIVLEQVYDKIKPLCNWHFNVNLGNPVTAAVPLCPRCGSSKVTRRGYRWSYSTKTRRFHCGNCGAWSLGKPERVKHIVTR